MDCRFRKLSLLSCQLLSAVGTLLTNCRHILMQCRLSLKPLGRPLKKILQSHYGAKNTSELYQALASLCQSSKESPQAFLMNAVDLRQQITFACGEGDDNTSLLYDSGHVQRLFLRSIETGLQDESIRAKIRPFLKDPNVTNEVLIQQMSMASSAEEERDKKLKTNNRSKPPTISVPSVSDDSPKDKQESKKSNSQSDILAAITAIKSEVDALKGEIRKQSSNQSVPHTKGPERKGPSSMSLI